MKTLRNEYSAILQTLERSSPALLSSNYLIRNFHTSKWMLNKSNEEKSKDENTKDTDKKNDTIPQNEKSGDEKLKEHNEKQMKRNREESKNKKKKDNDLLITLFTKGILWTAFIYSFIISFLIVMSVLFSRSPETNRSYEISWREFIYYVLPSGEVREIIVNPELEKVFIVTHPGSIISIHRPIRAPYFVLTVPDSVKFEEKVREVERKMGIQDGIPIRYDRGTPEILKIITTLALAGIVLAILRKTSFKMSGGSFDSIVITSTIQFCY